MLPQEAVVLYKANEPVFIRDYVEKVSTLPPEDQAAVYWVAGLIQHFATKPQNLEAALWNYEQGFAAAHEAGDYAGAAQNLAAIGCVQRVYGTKATSPEGKELDYAQARTTLNKAIELALKANYAKGYVEARNQLSLMQPDNAAAYSFNKETLAIARNMPPAGATVDLLTELATRTAKLAAENTEDNALLLQEAETYFQESFALTETLPETEDPEYKSIWNNLRYGEFLEKQNNPEALGFLQRAVEIARNYKEGEGNLDAIEQAERSRDAYVTSHPEIAAQLAVPNTNA
jgi:hypothetical protein